jgi:hypothetical protein
MDTKLSTDALNLLYACATGDNPRVDASNLEAYRELAAAGVMYPVSGFRHGPEAMFRFTESGWRDRLEILAQRAGSPLATS